ncbi:hypothetical protein AZE42_10577 [Rhizopogon vesiculosus]|uniref:Uncharacterized protein n=1 Tax=Rhizopogon vesiculosus TaxID=180088 RepID=A0A1J8PFX7_9AGAM|nr:hypothetical protein AZE42_10577 [Rhizopogon vesiculosus]
MHVEADGHAENVFKVPEFRRSGGYPESTAKVKKIAVHDLKISSPTIPSAKKLPVEDSSIQASSAANYSDQSASIHQTTHISQGRIPSLSVSYGEEENARSKHAKKPRTREPSWSHIASPDARQPLLASSQIPDPTHKVKTRQPSESRLSAASGSKTSSSSLDNDNEFSTASVETAATSVSLSIPAARKRKPSVQVQKEETTPQPVRRNLACNPSMFGPELPCPQATSAPPSRIPLSSPIYTASLQTSSPSTPSSPPLSRPRTLRRAARRISFGSLASARAASPIQSGEGSPLALGSAFQLA